MKDTGLPWYFKNPIVVLALLSVGPFALPLIWFNPRYALWLKWLTTIVMLALTYYLSLATVATWKLYEEVFRQLSASKS